MGMKMLLRQPVTYFIMKLIDSNRSRMLRAVSEIE